MIGLLKKRYCKRNGIPYKIYDSFYNYMSMNEYGSPINMVNIYDDDGNYIPPKKGGIVNVLFRSKEGQTDCLYKIVKLTRFGDYDFSVDLIFIKFVEKIDFDEMTKRLIQQRKKSCELNLNEYSCDICLYKEKDGSCFMTKYVVDNLK